MAPEQTLSIIKPDAVRKELIGEILARFERSDLRIKALKMVQLSLEQAKAFYTVHKDRPFYEGLCTFMASGPVVVALLEGEDAIASTRELMGATDPKEAAPGTIRAEFAEDIEANAVHGSDSPETAVWEVDFFFDRLERCER